MEKDSANFPEVLWKDGIWEFWLLTWLETNYLYAFCWDSHAIPGLCGQREEASTRTSLGQEAKLGDMFKAGDTMPSKKKIVLTFAEKNLSLSF